MISRISPSVIQLATLALWLGAAAFFSIAVAPALFAVLPSRNLAGVAVARMLPAVFYSGIVAGVIVAGLHVSADRDVVRRGGSFVGAVMVIACAVAQFLVVPRINRLRAQIGSPIDDLAVDDARRVAFGRLHGMSVVWLGIAMLAAVAGILLAARAIHAENASG